MNCIRCGRAGAGWLFPVVLLKDKNRICYKCFKELGFNPLKEGIDAQLMYTWDDICEGRDGMWKRRAAELKQKEYEEGADKYGISPTHYEELAAAGSTDNEIKIFSAICAVLRDEGRDADQLDVELGDNGSLNVKTRGITMLRYKSEPNVKWIMFPNESEEKIRIGGVARINSMAPRIAAAYDFAVEKRKNRS